MLITHILHQGPRAVPIINQGLSALDADINTSDDCYSFGEMKFERCSDLTRSCIDSDFIFCGKRGTHEHIFDDLHLWDKVIWYDFEDYTDYSEQIVNKCLGYFKRSTYDRNRNQVNLKTSNKTIHEIDYCVLDEYLGYDRNVIYNVACMFGDDDRLCRRRLNLKTQALLVNFKNSFIGTTCDKDQYGSIARNSLKYHKSNNCFDKYLSVLNSSKIILTAAPMNHSGDSRIWEALSSRSLVFTDELHIKNEFPLKDGEHILTYDSLSIESINNMLNQVIDIISDDKLIDRFSTSSYEYVMEHHRPIDRVIYMFKSIGIF